MTTPSTYRRLAQAQGVVRPFDILVRMEPAGRKLVADLLRCNLRHYETPHAQAWRIINQNLRGLQARTHTLPEQLTPFSRNNNWWEILTRTARRIGIKFYPGVGEKEVERLLFERFAEGFVKTNVSTQTDAVDSLAEGIPVLKQVMASMRLSRDATRTVLSAIAMGTASRTSHSPTRCIALRRHAGRKTGATSNTPSISCRAGRASPIHGRT